MLQEKFTQLYTAPDKTEKGDGNPGKKENP